MTGLYLYIYYASIISIVPAFAWTLIVIRRTEFKDQFLNRCGLLFFLIGISDLTAYLLAKAGVPNALVSNIYCLPEFILFGLLFIDLIPKYKWFIYVTGILFLLFVIINSIFIQGIWEFQSYSVAIESLLLVTYCFVYYLSSSHKIEQQHLEYRTLIVAGIFLYFNFVNLMLFMLSGYVFKYMSPESGIILWGFHNAFNITKNIFFAAAMYHAGKVYTKKGIRLI